MAEAIPPEVSATVSGPQPLKKEYPLHNLVWTNSYQELDDLLKKKIHDKEENDPRGR
jgi:hypothetical protein